MKYDLIVIGGGPSGMMAAGTAASRGKKVLLLEKNKNLGEKLLISGGGRCNLTNAEESEDLLLLNYGKAKGFLYSSFNQFGMRDTFNFFEKMDLPLVVQARKRAFPKSEKSTDVFKALEKYMKKGGVEVKSQAIVEAIIGSDKKISHVLLGGSKITADSYILATGGKSHPETGSTGDGFKWLSKLGHTVKDSTPTIVPWAVKEAWVKSLSGVSLSAMKLTLFVDGKSAIKKKGKILFTHFGFSGPMILNLAAKVHDLLQEGEVTVEIDAYPDTDLGTLDKRVTKVFNANKNKLLNNIFSELAPDGLTNALLSLLTFDSEIKVHSVTKEQRKEIVNLLKAMPATITGLMGTDRAVITDGGISIKEVDGKTMRSRLYNNLYVTGDLLHISRPSGGYSLQLCWTTGFVAGSHA
ncbi:MAG: aminoacetone oxidase family FAD-binding enzyme [bacterium]|nr:aminoacetone oxidase family FAD-binding enzyme [bacterium]